MLLATRPTSDRSWRPRKADLFRAAGLAITILVTSGSAWAQGDDLLRMKDGRELRGRVVSERFDRLNFSMRRGASTSIDWNDVADIDYHAPQPYSDAVALHSAGLWKDALDAFSTVREIKDLRRPLQQETLYYVALLRKQLGDLQGATDGFRELLEDFPTGRYLRQATRGLVLGLLAQGQTDDAAAVIGRVESDAKTLLSDDRLAAEVVLLHGKVAQAQGRLEEARSRFADAEANPALQPWDRADASLGVARILEATGESEAAEQRYRNIVEGDASPLVLAAAWNHLADVRLEAGRQARDASLITDALYGYLRGVVLYVPQAGDSHDEFHRALAGAAQCFEYLSQLATDPKEKALNRRRAADLRQRLERDE